jgi:predicted metal-binding membrane protein
MVDSPMNRTRSIASPSPLAGLGRGQLILLIVLAILTVGAWALTVHQARTMDMPMGIVLRGSADTDPGTTESGSMGGMDMDGMDMGGSSTSQAESVATSGMSGMEMGSWTWDGFSAFFVAWAVMMAAMMFPAVSPLLLLYHRMAGRQGFVPTWVFAAGYLLVWVVIGAATWVLVQVGIELGGQLTSADRESWAPIALGGTLVIAGAYQFSPIKDRCLSVCQSPVSFLMTHWRAGYRGALRMGVEHGAYCLGCCWALFAVLVAAGVMSLAWMLLLTLIVFAEKVLPVKSWGPRAVGSAFVLLGVLVAAGSFDLPWVA